VSESVTGAVTGFAHDADLSLAATIPATWYRDPRLLELEEDRIFARTWQLVGHTEQVRLPSPT
jgi:choline monooxygenase